MIRHDTPPFLWPRPQRVSWTGKTVPVPERPTATCEFAVNRNLRLAWQQLNLRLGIAEKRRAPLQCNGGEAWLRIVRKPDMKGEGYRLAIGRDGVVMEAATPRGVRYGLDGLGAIVQRSRRLPCGRIDDWPDFPVRGFMLDISRGKAPTREALLALLNSLAALRYNHLQLYTEHTFAFNGHRKVWDKASPMTAADIAWLQRRCEELDIELTPNFNSFGHFEQWLKHPEYRRLAECPDGFVHPLKGRMPHGTTLYPDKRSLAFLQSLWAEYLPLFHSERFNLGGDEPWELGLGRSRVLVGKVGKHRVYLDFLKQLRHAAAGQGKKILFWGDILLEAPELVKEVPSDATALLWGYEADHPFAEQCARLAAAKRKFWACPGTSAWNTFTGRTDNMLANIASAAKHGLKNGAEGLLLTSWGDGGNHQPWPVMYPGIVYAAGMAWNARGTKHEDVARAVNVAFGQAEDAGCGETLLELGRAESSFSHPRPNRSRHYNLFFASRGELEKELATLPAPELRKAAAALAKVRAKLERRGGKSREIGALDEVELGAEMAAWAVKRAQWTRAGKSTRPLIKELRGLIKRFERVWPQRGRPGGRSESVARMRAVEKEL